MPDTEHRPTTRILDILELLADVSSGLSLTEISEAINAPKSSISPLIHTLASRKYIFYNKQTQKYSIGIAAFSVGSAYIKQMTPIQFIQSEMRHLTDTCGETCQLGIRDKDMVLYIAKVEPVVPIRLISYVGSRLPCYCTAIGRSLIYDLSLKELKQLYPRGLQPFTSSTTTDFNTLFRFLQEIKSTGISKECEETTPNLVCIATPLCKGTDVVAALSVSVPIFRMTPEKEAMIIELLKSKRKTIEIYFNDYDIDPNLLAL